eukprot:TRINITY_DN24568_c0_g1_i1.p1 TRINITY_DN24568_c0_g1~~TRINITY_DN24568_c0_g1_i1.p1  ORF type:complete len:269 (-),score=41.32 TRINITY_DN24568_c0_g1_i1:55-771(-)
MTVTISDEPKTVVCFGDSNTFGAPGSIANKGGRLAYKDRWTTILQQKLGPEVIVIPEGLNGRTTVLDDPFNWANSGSSEPAAGANGRRYLLPMLKSHRPVDVVVLGLGTNDLKTRFNLNPGEIAKGCNLLIQDIKNSECGPNGESPEIVLLSPPAVKMTEHHEDFGPNRVEKALATAKAYEELARNENLAAFVNLKEVPLGEDGLHFEKDGSTMLGPIVAEQVTKALSTRKRKASALE